jgi:exodeoxyribonuclease VII large subunit
MFQTKLTMPAPTTPAPVLTVTELNQGARQLLERSFGHVQVAGEISNLKRDRSGHVYLALKDPTATLNAALFRREAQAVGFALENGLSVIATGTLTVYAPSGRYQLVIKRVVLEGAGALQAAFDALKAKLLAEGLFDAARKRPLPLLPRRVAVVTSLQGAVLRDIVHVSRRRFDNAQLLVVPCRVQGAGCGAELAQAVAHVGQRAEQLGIDVLIVARGGGAMEELWGFNDEALARQIAACPIAVVSAIGHETDFTIADFVSDVRAPTPSAAAELVFPVKSELHRRLRHLVERSAQGVQRGLQRQALRLRVLRAELGDGRRTLWPCMQRLTALHNRLEALAQRQTQTQRRTLQLLQTRLQALHPRLRLAQLQARFKAAQHRCVQAMQSQLHARRQRLLHLEARLQALSPVAVLGRGYAIVLTAAGEAVRAPDQAPAGSQVQIRLAEGRLQASIIDGGEKFGT